MKLRYFTTRKVIESYRKYDCTPFFESAGNPGKREVHPIPLIAFAYHEQTRTKGSIVHTLEQVIEGFRRDILRGFKMYFNFPKTESDSSKETPKYYADGFTEGLKGTQLTEENILEYCLFNVLPKPKSKLEVLVSEKCIAAKDDFETGYKEGKILRLELENHHLITPKKTSNN